MGWDGVDMAGEQGRRSVADVLSAEFSAQGQTVVALDASVAKGRAYLAVRGADGQVRPVYLLLDPIDETDPAHPFLSYKDYPAWRSAMSACSPWPCCRSAVGCGSRRGRPRSPDSARSRAGGGADQPPAFRAQHVFVWQCTSHASDHAAALHPGRWAAFMTVARRCPQPGRSPPGVSQQPFSAIFLVSTSRLM
jgi:hypothetical protein